MQSKIISVHNLRKYLFQPDSVEGNEMVFCDSCNICVHQICYGITKIPEGSWLCRTCALGIRPACVLCPNRGGAMKTTRFAFFILFISKIYTFKF